ncbi:MAG TPA: EAL domain-containing protein [Methylophilus sp.]|uniref:bifunctional diguanylate cyclase/phosphodiesterase n=1 Tax=Methylophilus sp. TaxID=29541 RepID=UPI002C7B421F|nr:EAL domain-containing protein [Methylophilus sp.]HSH87606.1 EAL domain-containing protein [Methylophilus sp.]
MFSVRLKNLSIQIKLLLAQGIVTISALLVLLAIVLGYGYTSFRNDLYKDLDTQATIIEHSSTAAILFGDKNAADEILSTFKLMSSINRAYLFHDKGALLAVYEKEVKAKPDAHYGNKVNLQALRQLRSSFNTHILIKDIVFDHHVIGTLFIEANLDKLNTRLSLLILAVAVAAFMGLIISLLISLKINKFLTQPILSLTTLVEKVSSSYDYSVRSHLLTNDEIGSLAMGINAMLSSIEQRDERLETELAKQKETEKALDRLAYFDTVTQLPNRHYFNQQLHKKIAEAASINKICCLMFIDLDDFKVINDTYGHRVGDQLLADVGQRLKGTLKSGDEVFRIGGDEFAILITDNNQFSHARESATKVIRHCAEKFIINNNDLYIGVSIGISGSTQPMIQAADLLRSADSAMYRAKNEGKNNFKFFSKEIDDESHFRNYLENALRSALSRKEFEVFYQPIVNLRTEQIVGFEALLRWHEPIYGDISPAVFIPCAERIGVILPIGEWVLREACLQQKKLRDEFGIEFMMNVNLSGRQLREFDVVHKILDIVSETAINPSSLNIELTESVLMDNSQSTINKFHALRAAGVSISIDDFGTGYSSLSYLKRFPINTIKIDRSFIMDIAHDSEDQAITLAIIALANTLKLTVVAEGVETLEQKRILRLNDCEKAQGYLFSKPLPSNDLKSIIETFSTSVYHQTA